MGWTSEIYLNKKKYQKMLEKIKNFKPGKLSVNQGDFEKVLKKHKKKHYDASVKKQIK